MTMTAIPGDGGVAPAIPAITTIMAMSGSNDDNGDPRRWCCSSDPNHEDNIGDTRQG